MSNNLKILHITKWFPGPEDEQLGVFVEKHVRCTLSQTTSLVLHLCPGNFDSISTVKEEREGLQIIRIEYPSEKNMVYKICFLSQAIKNACRAIASDWGHPDIIHAHILAQPVLIARKYFSGCPIITSEHWTGFVNGYFEQLPPWKRSAFRKAAAWSEVVTVPSPALLSAMRNDHRFKANFEILPNVIEAADTVIGPDLDSTFKFMVVADLHDHNKNISGTLRAFEKLDANCRLEIIGEGEDEKELKELAASLGILDRSVFFLGRKPNPEVLQLLPSAGCLIVNSRFETFSMITAEALASGVPVIATRSGGPEQFVDGTNGILIEKDSDDQLAGAMQQMIKGHQEFDRKEISERFKTKFSPATIGKQLLDMYTALADQRN